MTQNKKPRGRPKKSATTIGAETATSTFLKREAKTIINTSVKNKIIAIAATGALLALISHLVRK